MNALDLLAKEKIGEEEVYVPKTDKGQRLLFVGRSGSGKSSAGISFPGDRYIFDSDNRAKGIVSALEWMGVDEFKRISFDYYNPKDGFRAIDSKLQSIYNGVEKRTSKIRTLQFDSIGSLAFLLLLDSQKLRGKDKGFQGKKRGEINFLHPDDHQYLQSAFRVIMYDFVMPINELGVNVIFSAWVTDKWGKPKEGGEFAPNEVIGEKLVGPENAVESLIGLFDETYYFRKYPSAVPGKSPKYTVEFNGAFAKSALNLPYGEYDITGKNFYKTWEELVRRPYLTRKEPPNVKP